jgi:hypothetical protein
LVNEKDFNGYDDSLIGLVGFGLGSSLSASGLVEPVTNTHKEYFMCKNTL